MSTKSNTDADFTDDTFITEGSGNVFLDLGFSAEEATKLQMRADLMHLLEEHIQEEGMTQQQAAELFGVTQPRVSDLMNHKTENFSLETLIGFAAKAGAEVGLSVTGLRAAA